MKNEALRKKATKEEAERRRMLVSKREKTEERQAKESELNTRHENMSNKIENEEEEIIVVEDCHNVESAISFDFMENFEEPDGNAENKNENRAEDANERADTRDTSISKHGMCLVACCIGLPSAAYFLYSIYLVTVFRKTYGFAC